MSTAENPQRSQFQVRERRRYSAVMPPSAWPHGRAPRQRTRRRQALNDLAAGVERWVRVETVSGSRGDWAAWALRLAAGIASDPAPDGSRWSITTHIDYP
jgi:hypothetical protein